MNSIQNAEGINYDSVKPLGIESINPKDIIDEWEEQRLKDGDLRLKEYLAKSKKNRQSTAQELTVSTLTSVKLIEIARIMG